MLALEAAKLDIVLPTDSIDLVFMHPFLSISASEPHICLSTEKASQIARIVRCLDIASNNDGVQRTHFTIFPEYSIPGLDGIATIHEYLESDKWKTGTTVIAGVDGLTKEQYRQLCRSTNTYVSDYNRPEAVNEGEWVNCAVTWGVTEDACGKKTVKRWIQPKLCPSGVEQQSRAQYMFEGKSVYIYESKLEDARIFRFFSLLCFDWTAPINTGITRILTDLNEQWENGGDPKFIHMIFILQHNKKPNHTAFLGMAASYFNGQTYPFVSRGESILAMVNTAGKPDPGIVEAYGFSSMVYPPSVRSNMKACPASYAIHTRLLRDSDALQTCRDSLFRENGACIHKFRAFQPRLLVTLPAQSRRLPLDHVAVHGIDVGVQDPRIPGGPVSAIVKWINDKVEMIDYMHAASDPVSVLLEERQKATASGLRQCGQECLDKIMSYANNYKKEITAEENRTWLDDIDEWTMREENSLRTLVYALSLIGCKSAINIDGVAQAYTVYGLDIIDIFVISGDRHKANFERVASLYPGYQGRKALIISLDKYDTPTSSQDRSIWDTSENIMRCGFHELKNCLSASSMEAFIAELEKTIGLQS
ncbi:MAG: hypothetical protein ABSG90_11855 [Dehalococcoidia bacterium]